MNFYNGFDKLNVPMYVCTDDWRILFRNKACKRYFSSPLVNGYLSKCFVDKVNTVLPEKNGEAEYIGFIINKAYKTAVCFEYHGNYVILFPTVFDFDLLFGELFGKTEEPVAHIFREILDGIAKEEYNTGDKFGTVEKLRGYIYSCIERYVGLAFYDLDKRVLGSLLQIYGFFTKSIAESAKMSGYKIQTDLSDILDLGDTMYTDTTYFTTVISGIMLFGLSLSDRKKCLIFPEHRGTYVRHTFKFSYNGSLRLGSSGNCLKDLLRDSPAEYMNVMLFDELCRALNWRLRYIVTDEELNLCIYFDVDEDNCALFRSAGNIEQKTPEQLISKIIGEMFLAF